MTARDNNLLNISWLCDMSGVSRSGYYNWINHAEKRQLDDQKDREDFNLILIEYTHRGYKKGARSLYMRLRHSGHLMNLKKIRRLMTKFNLFCPIRQPNPYKKMAKARKESATKPNELNRQFRGSGARAVLLTDITYLFYGRSKRAYLSTIKDGFTKEILAYVVSPSLEVDFVLETINQLIDNHGVSLSKNTLIHSDQGVHYTSIKFQTLLSNKELRQSMSRRGNCWDNAPQESFFGHMKDEIELTPVNTFLELVGVIDDYMDYYNHDRYQWNLAKLTPTQYYVYSQTGYHPLSDGKS